MTHPLPTWATHSPGEHRAPKRKCERCGQSMPDLNYPRCYRCSGGVEQYGDPAKPRRKRGRVGHRVSDSPDPIIASSVIDARERASSTRGPWRLSDRLEPKEEVVIDRHGRL